MNENRPVLKLKYSDISIVKKQIISEIIERSNIKHFKNLPPSEKVDEKIVESKKIIDTGIKQELVTTEQIKIQPAKIIIPFYKKFKHIHTWLQVKCPKVITNKPSKVFAIGIHKEIAKLLDISIVDAKLFCKNYCNIDYQRLVIENAERFNLNNEVTGTVTKEQAIKAKSFVEFKEKSKQIVIDTKVETIPIKN
jgi:hypothetical protein